MTPEIVWLKVSFIFVYCNYFVNSSFFDLNRPNRFKDRIKILIFGIRHYPTIYDADSMKNLLLEAGFIKPMIIPSGVTNITNPEPLNLNERSDESVYIEAYS